MKVRSASFVKSGTRPEHFPPNDLPEFAFAGRSNVGKSSLMNMLVQRKGLVRVSGTPGRTQLLSWFNVNDELLLCDLPGYGYAKVPESVRRKWGPMVNTYLTDRSNLLALAVLADIRRGYQAEEMQLIEAAHRLGLHIVLVVTKCDKLSRNKQFNRKQAIAKELGVDPKVDIVWTSAESSQGRDALWRRIRQLLPLEAQQ